MFIETVPLIILVHLLSFQTGRDCVLSQDVSASCFSNVLDHDKDVQNGFSKSDYVVHDLFSISHSRLSHL